MEFITQDDLNLIVNCAGKPVDKGNQAKLKTVYSKLEHICVLLEKRGFRYSIRKDPRRQAGQAKFVFQGYQWAKVYPSELYELARDKFAYLITFTEIVHFHIMGIKDYQHHDPSQAASEQCMTKISLTDSDYEKIVDQFIDFDKKYRKLFIQTGAGLGISEFIKIKKEMRKEEIKKLLEYKKQIILQGPPGTGKTRMAKEISYDAIPITDGIIATLIVKDLKIDTVKGDVSYVIMGVDVSNKQIKLLREKGTFNDISFNSIKTSYNEKRWLNEIDNNNDRMAVAVAKYISNNILEASGQFKLIQFHPSYSYEDFVRGIVAKPGENGEGIFYKAENKTLASFAKSAYQNYIHSQKQTEEIPESKFKQQIQRFTDDVQDAIDKNGEYPIGTDTSAKIVGIENDGFIYLFEKRKDIKYKLLFSDLIKIENYPKKIQRTIDIRDIENGYLKMKGKHPYYFKIFNLIKNVSINEPEVQAVKTDLKNYVIVIDEINRANLSSVLGELIYALEYRGQAIDSIYDLEEDGLKIILPPNLFIIGTMNTADRSVGHIDYAIRRRFAFVEILPSEDVIKDVVPDPLKVKAVGLFNEVARLFVEGIIAPDFKAEDVQLGHSYFLAESADELNLKLKYEIKPLLKEYLKDGILQTNFSSTLTTENYIEQLSF